MNGKIFSIRKKFKGKITVIIDINEDEYILLDPRKIIEITQS